MDNLKDIIAKNLNTWMANNPGKDTGKKLSTWCGVGVETIRRIRNGDGNATIKNLALVAAAFGKTVIDLMTPVDDDHKYHPAKPAQPLFVADVLPITAPTNERERLIEKINAALPALNKYGLVAVLEKAKDAERDYPAVKQNAAVISMRLWRQRIFTKKHDE